MLAKVNSVSLLGLETFSVLVEADISNGLPAFDIVDCPILPCVKAKNG